MTSFRAAARYFHSSRIRKRHRRLSRPLRVRIIHRNVRSWRGSNLIINFDLARCTRRNVFRTCFWRREGRDEEAERFEPNNISKTYPFVSRIFNKSNRFFPFGILNLRCLDCEINVIVYRNRCTGR